MVWASTVFMPQACTRHNLRSVAIRRSLTLGGWPVLPWLGPAEGRPTLGCEGDGVGEGKSIQKNPGSQAELQDDRATPPSYTSSEQRTHDLVTMSLTTLMTLLRLSVSSIQWQPDHALSIPSRPSLRLRDSTIPQFHDFHSAHLGLARTPSLTVPRH